jgi:hypothetical protein
MNVIEKSNALANSYYFPVFDIKQKAISTTNPVNVFGMKLMKEDFKMADFQNVDKLNNPDAEGVHQTTLSLYLPIDIAGGISAQKNIIAEQGSATLFEKKWIQSEIKKNLYSLYYANIHLLQVESFLRNEKKFLGNIIKNYDTKSSENKNRFLSYNQARIILENISDGLNGVEAEKQILSTNTL